MWGGETGYRIELLEIMDPERPSPIDKIVKGNHFLKSTPYHICYETENMKETIDDLRKERFIPLDKQPSISAVFQKDVFFMYHKDIGIIELITKETKK